MALTDNILFYYKLDEASGNTVNDATDNNNNGTSYGVTVNQTGLIEKAYNFNGPGDTSNRNRINVGISRNRQDSFGVNCWFKTSGTSLGFILYHNGGGEVYILDNGKLRFYLRGNLSDTTATYNDGEWHMISFGSDGKAYIDGTLFNTISAGTLTGSYPLEIGGRDNSTPYSFNGLIDEYSYWTSPLSSDKVSELYNSGNGLQYPFTATTNTSNFFQLL